MPQLEGAQEDSRPAAEHQYLPSPSLLMSSGLDGCDPQSTPQGTSSISPHILTPPPHPTAPHLFFIVRIGWAGPAILCCHFNRHLTQVLCTAAGVPNRAKFPPVLLAQGGASAVPASQREAARQ